MTLALQQSKTASDTREKLRLNFHSLSLSVSELLEYGRKIIKTINLSMMMNSTDVLLHYFWKF
jgi:hypothetical protein